MNFPFSYSSVVRSVVRKRAIFSIENLTGRKSLLRRLENAQEEIEAGANFWDVMAHRFGITPHQINTATIPRKGAVLIVANHPNGILDGLGMGALLQSVRPDFKILAQAVFDRVDPLSEYIIPVSFGETDDAVKINLQARRDAISWLKQGGCVCIFPAGGVSTAQNPFGQAKDTKWRNFVAKLAAQTDTHVVPIYIPGQNSRLFQIISRISDTLRKALLIYEFKRRLPADLNFVVGDALPSKELAQYRKSPAAMTAYLYEQTYALAPDCVADGYGYEFNRFYRKV